MKTLYDDGPDMKFLTRLENLEHLKDAVPEAEQPASAPVDSQSAGWVSISEEEQMVIGGLLVWLEKTELPQVSIGMKIRWMEHLEKIVQRKPNGAR